MPIKSKGGKGKPKPDQPAMRGALDHRKKETMLAVIVRNQKVLDQVRVLLKPRDLRDFGVHYGVVYQATLSCFDQYGEMPSQEMLLTEVQQQIKDNPGQMTDSEVDAAEEFISTAYDLPEWGGKDISTDATYAKFAIQTFKLFKEEALAERVQEATSRDGKFAADLAPMLRTVALEVDQARAVGRKVTDQPFPDGWQLRKLVPPVSSGISILNAFTGGGLKPGEVLLFMGPYGSCKTTLAVQGVVAAAKLAYAKTASKTNKNGLIYKTVYFSYEADREEFQERCLAYGARLPRRRQNKLKGNYLTAFAPDAELLPYELKMYAKEIAKGVAVPNEYARVNSTVKLLNEHLLFVDMTNADSEAGGQGLGGPNEVMAYLTLRKHENKKLRFHNIWIDHAAAMVGNMLDSDNYTFDDSRPILKQLPRQLRNWVAKRFKCQVYLLHQLSGEANKAAPTSQTHHTEADECKSIGMYPDFCVQTGPPTRDGRCLAVFDCTKHRRQPPKPRMVVRIDGQRNRVVSVNDKYTIENSTIVDTADAATVQVVAKKKKTDGGPPSESPPPPPAAAKGGKKGKKGDIKPNAVNPFSDVGAGG